MDFDSLVGALKIAGATISGILGAAGLLFNFKDEEAKLTRAGKFVLGGIIVSALVTVASSGVEVYKSKSESAKQLARTEHLLHELNRAVQPITKLEARYWVEIPGGNPIIDAYLKRVDATIESRIDQLRQINGKDTGLHASAVDSNGDPITVEINEKSDLWPRDAEAFIANAIMTYVYTVFIFKEPTDIQKFVPVVGRGDFSASAILTESGDLSWDRKEKKLYIWTGMVYEKFLWKLSGRVTSVVDLMGAQLILIPPSGDFRLPPRYAQFRNKELEELQRAARLKTIVFHIADGRDIWLSGKSFKATKMFDGQTVLSLILPTNETDFRMFTSSASTE